MLIRAGFEIAYECYQPTPMMLALSVHPTRAHDIVGSQAIQFSQYTSAINFSDSFGNQITRIIAQPGMTTMSAEFQVQDSGLPDAYAPDAVQHAVQDLPEDVLVYLLGSRYCDTDKLHQTAWSLFGGTPLGWARVQAIVDYTHQRIKFSYQHADSTRTATDGHAGRIGVCRDYAHLAIALCRCMNIPARYCTGYLGDIGVPPVDDPMDFSAWFEVYLGGQWYTFDARHNKRRIGRIVMARGRDATDVAITTTFGSCRLAGFRVITDELQPSRGVQG